MKYTSAKDPKFTSDDQVELTVKFEKFGFEVPFVASPTDIEPHGVELYNRAIAGDFGPIAPFINI